jgi:hypothetical protein
MMHNPAFRFIADDTGYILPRRRIELREIGIHKPELRHVFKILDLCVQADGFARFEVAHAPHEFFQMKTLPLMNCRREAVGLSFMKRDQETVFGSHPIDLLVSERRPRAATQ